MTAKDPVHRMHSFPKHHTQDSTLHIQITRHKKLSFIAKRTSTIFIGPLSNIGAAFSLAFKISPEQNCLYLVSCGTLFLLWLSCIVLFDVSLCFYEMLYNITRNVVKLEFKYTFKVQYFPITIFSACRTCNREVAGLTPAQCTAR